MANPKVLQPFLLSWEGGFVEDPRDSGGATNMGITIGTYRSAFGKDKTVEDLKTLTTEQWYQIFKRRYWDRCKADQIDSQAVANILVDWLWMSGTRAVKQVQSLLGVGADGKVGPETLAAINGYPRGSVALFDAIKNLRVHYINKIAVGQRAAFRNGWMRRLAGLQTNWLRYCNGRIIKF